MLNDPTYVEAARVLAARLIREASIDPSARLDLAFRLALARPPRPEETTILTRLLIKHEQQYQDDPASAHALLGIGDAPVPDGLNVAELAAWTSVTRTLLNLHETITRN